MTSFAKVVSFPQFVHKLIYPIFASPNKIMGNL